MRRTLSVLLLVTLTALPCAAPAARRHAAAPPPTPAPSAAPSEISAPIPDSVTKHTVAIDGQVWPYTARAGVLTLRDQQGRPTANVFYTAYTVEGIHRPVTFLYNGGPGSSTMWLHMGSFGPVRVLAADGTSSGPPPYRIVENPYCLLDKTDLVFIDMPDSGFGRILPGGKPSDFFGVDQDVAAFGQFISTYLSRFNRWNSPKFIYGESYGTTRSAALADYLLNQGIFLNGIVLQSSILSFGLDFSNGDPIAAGDWPYVFYLPTEAATAWYHHRVPNQPDLRRFLRRVEYFAMGEYLDALYRGDRLGAAERDDVVRKLSAYLGLPQQYVRNANIRVPYDRFQRELLRDQGLVVGRLDSRYTTYETDRAALEGPQWDPTDSSIDGPYTTAINQYLRDDLKYNPPIPYRADIYDIIGSSWNSSHHRRYPTNVAPDLADAMTQEPSLKVFSANGYFDFATPFFATEYTLGHLNLDPSLQKNITFRIYESGHMIYLSESALAQYRADLGHWYDSVLGQ